MHRGLQLRKELCTRAVLMEGDAEDEEGCHRGDEFTLYGQFGIRRRKRRATT